MGANSLVVNQVARTPWAQELLLIGTLAVKPAPQFANDQSLMARCRLELGPVRYAYTEVPTASVGMYLQPGDLLELSHPEMLALMRTGGFIRDVSAGADAKLWIHYYR